MTNIRKQPSGVAIKRMMAVAVMGIATQQALAVDPFFVLATADAPNTQTQSAGSSDARALAGAVLLRRGSFSSLNNEAVTATLSLQRDSSAHIDVLTLNSNAAGTSATLTSNLSGHVATFVAPTREGVRVKVDDFLNTHIDDFSGGSKYQKALNTETYLGVMDGNPQAAAPLFATDGFRRFGLDLDNPPGQVMKSGAWDIGIEATGGAIDAGSATGPYAAISPFLAYHINDRVALALSLPLEWRQARKADSYIFGANLGVPITIVGNDKSDWAWSVTPFATLGGGVAERLLTAGGVWGGGITSSLRYRQGDFSIIMGNQASYTDGFSIPIDQYDYHSAVNQPILKNGVRVVYAPANGLFVDAGFSVTNMLSAAAVDDYCTPDVGIGYRFGSSVIRVSCTGDFGGGYSDVGGNILFGIGF